MTQPPYDPNQPGQAPHGQHWPPPYPGQNHPLPPPKDSTNLVLGLLLGMLIGTFLGGILTFTIFFASMGSGDDGSVLLAVLLPFLAPLPLLGWKNTRPWGFGILMGVALGSVVLAGSCVWLIDGLSQAH